jgi:ComF family protein
MGKLLRWVFFLREYFFPFGCSLCGVNLSGPDETWYGLCGKCHSEIEAELCELQAMKSCDFCGKPLISERVRCLSCPAGKAFDRTIVLFPYMGKYKQLLASYKFGKNIALAHYFAEKICWALEAYSLPPEASIVPVPPQPGKIRKAGWDQVAQIAKLLKKKYAKTNRFQVSCCLKRLPSKSQKALGQKNRQTNLRGRIVPVKEAPPIAIVIDDVKTTGSTLDACAAALKEKGSQKVYGLCLFYT